MRRPEFVAGVAALAVIAGNLASLLSAHAPRGASPWEYSTFILTLPASLLSMLIRSRDQDSILFWGAGALVWAAGAFAQFWVLAALPRYMRNRPVQRQLALAAAAILFGASVLWLASSWPSGTQEEPVLFFIRTPLWLLTASAVMILLVWSPWRKESDGSAS